MGMPVGLGFYWRLQWTLPFSSFLLTNGKGILLLPLPFEVAD